jgi:cellulose synthase/poly-beta-1,6-N-acetylglucosamine synthase-like glycosyltransferase
VFQARGVLNPFRVGFFTVSVVSHKILRWFTGLFVLVACLSGLSLLAGPHGSHSPALLAVLLVALAGALVFPQGRRALSLVWYFAAVNAASLVGIWRGSVGAVSGVWSTPRQVEQAHRSWLPPVLAALVATILTLAAVTLYLTTYLGAHRLTVALFWTALSVLAYVYFGYPLIMLLLRTVARRPTTAAAVTPRVCLFITAHDEAAVISEKIRNSLALDYPRDRLQIVVASDGSTDGTNALVEARASDGVRLLAFPERRGKISAINRGVPSVDAEIVVFSDANTFLEPGSLRALMARFADEQVGAVSGDVVLIGDRAALAVAEDLYYRYERWLQDVESDVGSMVGADGALYAIRRELFVPPADDTILDDMFIPLAVTRAGRRVVFQGSALAYEQGSRSAVEEFSRKSRVVAGSVQLIRRAATVVPWWNAQVVFSFFSHKVLRWLSPWVAVVVFLTSAGLAATAGMYVAILGAQLLFMGAGLLGCVPALRRRLSPLAFAHYFWLVQGAALVGLARGVAGMQRTTWRRFAHEPVAKPSPPSTVGHAN